jgi:Dolichyl-phosphate-mannose-protein mannosyltransferase
MAADIRGAGKGNFLSSASSLFRSTPATARGGALNFKLGAVLMLAAGCIYSFHIGRPFAASEAYSAMAADQPNYGAVIQAALRFDQCKPPLYQILLHTWALLFGSSDVALRVLSLMFSVASVGLAMALGTEMFAPATGVAAAVLWALSPTAIIYGAWARMYSMYITLALAQFLMLWNLLKQPSPAKVAACGALGAAMLYTHLGGVLFLGAEAAMLVGAAWRGQQTRAAWTAILLAAVAFVPFIPLATSQVSRYLNGHWVDWIGPAHQVGFARKTAAFLAAGITTVLMIFGPRAETDDREPLRWCVALSLLPIGALAAGSVAIRPMFDMRYVAPSAAMLALVVARLISDLSSRWFSLTTFGIGCFLFFMIPYYRPYDPWRDVARQVAIGSSAEPVFFESGYVGSTVAEPNPDMGFPQGFFRVPFDRYFLGPNPRIVVDPSAPTVARQTIAQAARVSGGAWLVTGLSEENVRSELPTGCFRVTRKSYSTYARLYHVVPLTPDCKH